MKVSILIPLFNAQKYITECIESCISQTYNNIEIIIVNDGSSDNSLQIVKNLEQLYTNILVIDQENKGAPSARNNAFDNATGDYVIFLDADDKLASDEIIHDFITLAEKENSDFLFGDESYYKDSFNLENQFKIRRNELLKVNKKYFFERHPITSSVMLRSDFLHNHSIRWNENLPSGQEFSYFFNCIIHECNISYLSKMVVNIRFHNSEDRISVSQQNKNFQNLQLLIEDIEENMINNQTLFGNYQYWKLKQAFHLGIRKNYIAMQVIFKNIDISQIQKEKNNLYNFIVSISSFSKNIGFLVFYLLNKAGYEIISR